MRGGHLTCVDASSNWIEVARRNLEGLEQVELRLGDITELRLEKGFDLIVIHYVLHEIPTSQRERVVQALVSNLGERGRLVICEPTRESDGMPVKEIRHLLAGCGLVEAYFKEGGSVYLGEYRHLP